MSGPDRPEAGTARPLGPARIDAVDLARGAALVAMAVYHFSWDLSFFQLIATQVGTDPAWTWFARIIAGSFLFLVGVSLVLGHGAGVRWRPFLRRLAMIAAAAAAITVATYFAFPDSYIFFGILHCIALSSLLALPFLRAPWPLVLAAAILVLAAPRLLALEMFNTPLLAWLGLGTRVPQTNDYVPIFPWFGMVLAGMAAGRTLVPWTKQGAFARWRARNPLARGLAWAGRHSLLIYLVHQPLLLGLLYPMAQILGPSPEAEAAPFVKSCARSCAAAGREPGTCERTCGCVVQDLKVRGLWGRTLRDQLSAEEEDTASALAQQCYERERNGASRP